MPATTRAGALTRLRHVCVIGAGTMGRGIAQVALQAGHAVTLVDPAPHQRTSAAADIATRLTKRHPETAAAIDDLLATVASVVDAEPHPETVVVEAVVEALGVKHAVFADALDHFGPGCVLATNTSSLSVTAIAAGSQAPERVVGMHFFNPVPAMRLVEVVRGLDTPEALAHEIADLAQSWGKEVAHVRSAPGFIVNRVARPFYGESLRLLEEGAADHVTLDALIRGAGGFRMGPFELMDLIGVEVNHTVTRTVWQAFNHDPRFAPSQVQAELVAAGRFGRKAGRGFYDHREGAAHVETPTGVVPGAAPQVMVRYGRSAQLDTLVRRAGHELREVATTHVPDADDESGHLDLGELGLVRVTRGRSAAAEAADAGRAVVVIDRCLDPESVTTLAAASTSPELLAAAAAALAPSEVALVEVADAPGLVVARVVSMIINEAWDAVHLGVATADDIDTAMTLGTNYPAGPFRWGESWGVAQVLGILDALAEEYRDPRYRSSQALRAAARAVA